MPRNNNESINLNLPNEEHSIELFRKIRWSEGVYCPKCHSFHVEKRGPQGRIHRYQCKDCNTNFSDFTNTIFQNSQTPIGTMFYILFNLKNKKTSQLAKETGLTRQTIYRVKKLFKEKTQTEQKIKN
ncbi:transposase [Methanobrevibacter curvatus]|uniref:Transposase zinc-ribbon domain protein n=1 Tax=Methanobrevibacter curvatus TaxID=49547 RepID=A0A166E9D8_9EURY|nr:transposase [Methanobrevibacter curvatus]KZX16415.1 transposase zinc-ribbon domain protein [Methanobrevibacter curvatus]